MNNFITLDEYKYATVANSWAPFKPKPNTVRYTLAGTPDITYGAALPEYWAGEIAGPVTARSEEWGTIDNLRASLVKKQALNFTDHYGDSYTVHSVEELKERSLTNVWDAPENVIYVQVRLVKEIEVVAE